MLRIPIRTQHKHVVRLLHCLEGKLQCSQNKPYVQRWAWNDKRKCVLCNSTCHCMRIGVLRRHMGSWTSKLDCALILGPSWISLNLITHHQIMRRIICLHTLAAAVRLISTSLILCAYLNSYLIFQIEAIHQIKKYGYLNSISMCVSVELRSICCNEILNSTYIYHMPSILEEFYLFSLDT